METDGAFNAPVEEGETYVGGRERSKHESRILKAGRGTVGKSAIVGAMDRASNRVSVTAVQPTDRGNSTRIRRVQSRT